MKVITLSGVLETMYWDSWNKLKLVQEDGYKMDLIGRFQEAVSSYSPAYSSIQVSYYLSDKVCTPTEVLEGWLTKISGGITAEYEANGYAYSSWTSGTDYDSVLKIGNHDLYSELVGEVGRFIIINICFK